MSTTVDQAVINIDSKWPPSLLCVRVRGATVTLQTSSSDKLVWLDGKEYPFSTRRAWESIMEKNKFVF